MKPEINVGIVSGTELRVNLNSPYTFENLPTKGRQIFSLTDCNKVKWNNSLYTSLEFIPADESGSFEVEDVVIGVNFHWQRRETQRFTGSLRIIVEDGKLTLVNRLPLEDYLKSVISSEMSATANLEFLKAHAVISRSWIMAQILNRDIKCSTSSPKVTDDEIVRWYDREDHKNFDVCADDHCQRYQGITRQTTPTVDKAVELTHGLVLTDSDGAVCDARFSKCCGGVFEQFENCWEPVFHSYLTVRRDNARPLDYPDLTDEAKAREWILTSPDAYCNTDNAEILGQVLNNYDLETPDFYRWKIHYSKDELSDIVRERSGIDFGEITALEPLERGTSGRIIRLRITGTKRSMVIGKELEIRRTLSKSHLYSSAFVVDTDDDGFTLTGAGWGHGVGLCQIGAAVMSAKGMSFDSILNHYFPGATLTKVY